MATWVHPASWSQSAKANRSAVIVRKIRTSLTGSGPSVLMMRHAATVFLWTSRPQQRGYSTSIRHLQRLKPRTGCPFHAESLLRASAGRSDKRWCLRASRPYCWQADGTRISRPSACGGQATIVALFIPGGEGNPHDVLLANPSIGFSWSKQRLYVGATRWSAVDGAVEVPCFDLCLTITFCHINY